MHFNQHLKIVYLIPGIYNSGGMERVLANKTNWLVGHGHQVHIVTTDQKQRPAFFDFAPGIEYHDLGINYEDIQTLGFVHKTYIYLRKQRLHKKRLKTLLEKLHADIVISMFGSEISFFWRIKDGSRKIAEIHFSKYFRMQLNRGGIWRLADWWRSQCDERYIRHVDRFVVLTHEDKTYWGNHSNIEVIHNACTFSPSEQANLTSKRAIAVGRLTSQKGFDMLIDAWQQVAAKHPDWKLTIVGGGEEKEARERQIIGLGLQDTVQLYPPTQHIERELLDSALYVLSSRYEGLPMVLLEAMSCGLPAVSFACKCGPRDVIEDRETGLLISPEDVASLAEGICRLIEDDALRIRMGHRAAQDVQERFATERIMNQWETLFFTLCHESNI